jgi:riboflavin transporter FmnP
MKSTKRIAVLGVMAALSVLLVYFIRMPIFPSAPFLEYDPADIPILICTLLYGPWNGLLLTIVVSTVQGLTVSAQSGIIGIVMHIFATGAFVLVAGLIYHRKKSWKTAIIGTVAGVLVMTTTMMLWNLLLTPLFLGVPMSVVAGMIIPIIMPFNLIKAGINGFIALVTFKQIGKALKEPV